MSENLLLLLKRKARSLSSPTMLLKHYQHVATAQKQRAIDSLPELHVPKEKIHINS